MSEDIYSQYLRFEVVESAASTLTEGSAILTGASVNRVQNQNIAMEIHAIGVDVGFPEDLPGTGAYEYVMMALSTRSGLTAFPLLDDEHCIYKNATFLNAGVATYLPLIVNVDRYMPHYVEFKNPLLISHTKLYPYAQSTNSGTAMTCKGYILFTYVLLDADLAIEALEAFR